MKLHDLPGSRKKGKIRCLRCLGLLIDWRKAIVVRSSGKNWRLGAWKNRVPKWNHRLWAVSKLKEPNHLNILLRSCRFSLWNFWKSWAKPLQFRPDSIQLGTNYWQTEVKWVSYKVTGLLSNPNRAWSQTNCLKSWIVGHQRRSLRCLISTC